LNFDVTLTETQFVEVRRKSCILVREF